MIYAGIGSRKTPTQVQFGMYGIAQKLGLIGFTLRSGRAIGADSAFEHGAMSVGGNREIFTPKMVSENSPWFAHAAQFHPNWKACDEYARKLHARNSPIVLGAFLNVPVDFILCWTLYGQRRGGTSQAMRIADANRIPIFNLAVDGDLDKLGAQLGIIL